MRQRRVLQLTHLNAQVAVVLGEQIGHYLNDWVMEVCIRRNKGVFEAEMRLWWVPLFCLAICSPIEPTTSRTCYVSVVLYIVGFVVLGACMEKLNVAGLVLGWGIAQCVVVFNTVAVCECMYDLYLSMRVFNLDCRRLLQRLLP